LRRRWNTGARQAQRGPELLAGRLLSQLAACGGIFAGARRHTAATGEAHAAGDANGNELCNS
jgi:hypothetical protein